MIAFLILLYVIVANGFIVPDWCFVAAWVLTILKAICWAISFVCKLFSKD